MANSFASCCCARFRSQLVSPDQPEIFDTSTQSGNIWHFCTMIFTSRRYLTLKHKLEISLTLFCFISKVQRFSEVSIYWRPFVTFYNEVYLRSQHCEFTHFPVWLKWFSIYKKLWMNASVNIHHSEQTRPDHSRFGAYWSFQPKITTNCRCRLGGKFESIWIWILFKLLSKIV